MNPLNHIAIIMDGNGRWGLKYKNSRNLGHKEGLKTIMKIVESSIENNIKFLTLFTFSIDNWKRPQKEIDYLLMLLENFLTKKYSYFNQKGIKLKFIGKKLKNKKINKLIKNIENKTIKNNNLYINLALNYGSKEEIISSVKKINKLGLKINKKNISKYLYTHSVPDPDVLIRTGNTNRLSNFLLWQISYAEIFFEKKMWPEFNVKDYLRIIKTFKKIKRNFGSI